jgi:MFS family permease
MKKRLPISASSTLRPLDLAFLKMAPFWIYSFGNMMQSIAYFLPQLWVPSFAREIGLPTIAGPLALCLLNLAACGGYISQGIIVDRYHVTVAIFIATVGSMLAIFVFWGLTTSQAMLYVFAILWGLTGGGFSANWAGCANAIRKSGYHVDTGMVISLLCVSKGVGSVVSGPISERLLQIQPFEDTGFAYGTRYGVVILFTGISATLGGVSCLARLAKVV